MSARLASLLLALLAPGLIAAHQPVLGPDISARQVQSRHRYTGAPRRLVGAVV